MEQKIIRISASLHNEYKELVSRFPKLTLSTATELLIKKALKRGEIEKSEKNAYDAVKELDETFRKWMRQQEKIHLTRISEELLALAHELKDTATRTDIEKAGNMQISVIEKALNELATFLANDFDRTKSEINDLKSRINKQSDIIEDKLSKKIF
ncbi:hypothetical protein JGH11_14485 [Dysgonomonas sp. Marseille-P4677]|uniref:hypothetical protein n=1 Tax=Dysgonomonas sp. Marseille-P4677 TaxID=2364790 RepID=UPI001914D803|nr:hypothetical protein [Dysgonomonas sp. Marseille-P4677]MBK5722082.1 hypothetical protein [Dysgonomonas sp. Marseille-P4677]